MFAILSSTGAGSGLEVISVTWDTRLSGGTDQQLEEAAGGVVHQGVVPQSQTITHLKGYKVGELINRIGQI